MRLIDADELKRKVTSWLRPVTDEMNMVDADNVTVSVIMEIEEAPTVDAVPVVRCKDCQCGKVSDTGGCVWCTCYEIHKSLNGFCDYGERKDGDR